MRLTRLVAILAAVALGGASQAPTGVSLVQVLSEISHFDDASLLALSNWASYQNPQPPDTPLTELDQVEVQALQLASPDRDALFSWLEHGGRSKLYAVGMADSQIGPCQPLIDGNACKNSSLSIAQSQTSRNLSFRSASQQASGVTIWGGFAAVSADVSGFTHCVAFQNTTQKTISAITFAYKLRAASGGVLSAGSVVAIGSFGAGFQATIPATASELQSDRANGQSLPPNCWMKQAAGSDPALAHAAIFDVAVASVTYEDGTHWP